LNNIPEYTPLSREIRIEKLYTKASMALFWHIKLNQTEQEKLKFLKQSYEISRAKMYNIKRNDWTDTFDHLLRVTYYILESKNPTLLKVLIALNHDNLEDTDIDFNWLKVTYWIPDIALWVDIISKKPFCNFIEDSKIKWSDYQNFEKIEEIWILNDKWLLSDDFLTRNQNNNTSKEEKNALSEYKILEKKYKRIRNETNFNHMLNFNTFYSHTLRQRNIYKLRITTDKVRLIALDALEVKYWDRIDNLKTSEIYTIFNEQTLKKARRKIKETEKYFYDISKKTHQYIHVLIKQEVERLRTYIIVKEMENNKDIVIDIIK